MPWSRRAVGLVMCLMIGLGCASSSRPPLPGTGSITGRLELLPHEGVAPGHRNAYGDRRVRDARLVDYERPGFSVVYIERDPAQRETTDAAPDDEAPIRLSIRPGRISPQFEPQNTAVSLGRTVELENRTDSAHIVSLPDAGTVRSLDPGERMRLPTRHAGAHRLYLLDVSGAEALMYVARGAFTVPRATGEFTIADIEPGRLRVHAWHPRFPPTSSEIVLRADEVTSVHLVLGVGREATSEPLGDGE